MVSITAKITASIDGVIFQEKPESEFQSTSARVIRTPTLDGGVVVDHRGFSDGDRTFKIIAELDEDTTSDLWYMHRNLTLLNISCREGFFEGAISDMKADHGLMDLTFLVKE